MLLDKRRLSRRQMMSRSVFRRLRIGLKESRSGFDIDRFAEWSEGDARRSLQVPIVLCKKDSKRFQGLNAEDVK